MQAFDQSMSNGATSGSSATTRAMSSSVIASSAAKSVSPFMRFASSSVTTVIRSLLPGIGFPGADDPSILTPPRVDDDVKAVFQLAKADDPCLAVIEPVVYYFDCFTTE